MRVVRNAREKKGGVKKKYICVKKRGRVPPAGVQGGCNISKKKKDAASGAR